MIEPSVTTGGVGGGAGVAGAEVAGGAVADGGAGVVAHPCQAGLEEADMGGAHRVAFPWIGKAAIARGWG